MTCSEFKMSTPCRKKAVVRYHSHVAGTPLTRTFDADCDRLVALIQSFVFTGRDFKVEFIEGDGYACNEC